MLEHRSPDEEGFFTDRNFEMGMGRLKIIDLKSEDLCPYREANFVLAYNGELYNYIELREELEKKGWQFRTTSDTEVLMKCWRQWGFKMFDKLNAMFAFAIYDSQKNQLVLARDIAGEKPLYYYKKNHVFAFASEAKVFTKNFTLTYQSNRFFEAFQHCFLKTLWNEVGELPPASYLVYDLKKNSYFIKPYWEFKKRHINLKTAQEELESLMDDAVKIRTRSDVPYGLYYSGGIDSALISTFHTFANKFYFDKSKQSKGDFFRHIEKVTYHLDFPVGSFSSYPLWKLAQRASKKVKVVISGEGADEIFGGYVRYLPIAREHELRLQYSSYNDYLFSKYFQFPAYLDGFTRLTARNDDYEYVRSVLEPFFKMFDDPINAMGFADFKLVLPSLFQMGDRMAGSFGIENRCPFLDRRIIEFGFSLPWDFKIKGLEQKVILRKILSKKGLTAPLLKQKEGLTIPANRWLAKKNDWDRSYYFNFVKNKWSQLYL